MLRYAVSVSLLLLAVFELSSAQQLLNLFDIAKQSNLSLLANWLEQSSLDSVLKDTAGGPFTLMAPSNAAFEELSPDFVWRMKSDPAFRDSILQYHVVRGAFNIADMADKSLPTFQGQTMRVNSEEFDRNKFRVEQKNFPAYVDFPNVAASNGVLHFIDRVLVPRSREEGVNLVEAMRSVELLNSFLSLAEDAGLLDMIRNGGPHTIFAPVDSAFQKVDSSILRQLRQEPRLLKAVIRSHMIPSVLTSRDIQSDSVSTNTLGELVIFRMLGNLKLINTARMLGSDILAKNGALHVIDSLLLPSINALGSQGPIPTMNIQTKLRNMGLTIFADLVEKANMASLLSANDSMTVFAPSNEAFNKLPASTVDLLLSDPTALLKTIRQHIVPEKISTSEFMIESVRNTLSSERLRLNSYRKSKSSTFTANGVPISVADENALNGVIHVVDSVLPSTDLDIIDVLKRDGRFGVFLEAAQAGDLIASLREDGPVGVTVFAPTDEAFQTLPPEEFFSALLDVRKLSDLVSNHLVSSASATQTVFLPGLCWSSFKSNAGKTLRTAMNSKGEVIISSGDGKIAKVLDTDLLATNGVIHVVDSLI